MIVITFLLICLICLVLITRQIVKTLKAENNKKIEYYSLRVMYAKEGAQSVEAVRHTHDLKKLLEIHKSLCSSLELNSNKYLGPCAYGMFRTKDIASMTADEVFLGDIYGLWTKSLAFWDKCKDKMEIRTGEETYVREIIFNQYYRHLYNNLKIIEAEASNALKSYKK